MSFFKGYGVCADGANLSCGLESMECIWEIQASDTWSVDSLYLGDGDRLCVVCDDTLAVFNTVSGERVAYLRSENKWGDCWLSQDGFTVYAGGAEGTLHHLRVLG